VSDKTSLTYTHRIMCESFAAEIDKTHILHNLKLIGFKTNRVHVRNKESSDRYILLLASCQQTCMT